MLLKFLLRQACIALTIVSAHEASARTWTEAGTAKKIEADFVSADAESVVIVSTGNRFTLPLARLSPEDQAFVRQQLAQKASPAEKPSKTKAEDRFEDVPKLSLDQIPANGTSHRALAPVDDAIRQFMVERGIPALSFAVIKGGKVLHDRAFGWADADLKTPLQPGVKMRVASMTKPVVKAAMHTLFADRKLKPDQLVFEVLNLAEQKESKSCDPRWKQVTLQQLLDHKGGWDRDKSGDLTTRSSTIKEMFRAELNEIEPMHIVRYGLTLPLDFDPGSREVYCNFGYIMLVRVIEKVTGQTFIDYLHETVCKDLVLLPSRV
jgi:CubicO group peptidase (beta-lactamase class C family)